MKKFFYFMVLALVPLCFTACGSDDDNSNPSIVGSWALYGEKSGSVERLTFSSDGSCKFYSDYGPDEPGIYNEKHGTYIISNSILTIDYTKKISTKNSTRKPVETSISETKTYQFSISGNKLTLTRESGKSDIYTRE